MKFKNFETEDPYLIRIKKRLEGVENATTDAEMFSIFIRNLCDYIHDFKVSEMIKEAGMEDTDLANKFSVGYIRENLYKWLTDTAFSKMISFTEFVRNELDFFYLHEKTSHYELFINQYEPIFYAIDSLKDCLINFRNNNYYIDFLKSKNVNLKHVQIDIVNSYFLKFEIDLMRLLLDNCTNELTFEPIRHPDLQQILKSIYHYLNSRLITDFDKKGLHQWTVLWFDEMLARISFVLGVETQPKEFVILSTDFSKALPFRIVVEDPEYPKDIFSSYKAYSLFDNIAIRMQYRVQFCFLYRYLYDKGLILVKDTPFREWFNNQCYQPKLTEATDVLTKCSTIDRKLLVKVMAEQIGAHVFFKGINRF